MVVCGLCCTGGASRCRTLDYTWRAKRLYHLRSSLRAVGTDVGQSSTLGGIRARNEGAGCPDAAKLQSSSCCLRGLGAAFLGATFCPQTNGAVRCGSLCLEGSSSVWLRLLWRADGQRCCTACASVASRLRRLCCSGALWGDLLLQRWRQRCLCRTAVSWSWHNQRLQHGHERRICRDGRQQVVPLRVQHRLISSRSEPCAQDLATQCRSRLQAL